MSRQFNNAYVSNTSEKPHANFVKIELVGKFGQVRLHKVPRVVDVELEV